MNKFERVEKKYLLTESECNKLFQSISEHLEKDYYYKSTICNIYFDSDNYDLIVHSLEKPIFKEKIRLRSYNVPNIGDNVFFEIKGKYNGIVYKRRVPIKLSDYYKYINEGVMPNDSQIMKEIDYIIKSKDLKPKLMLAYDRLSYHEKDNIDFRITFDKNVRSREEDLNLEYGDAGKLYFKDHMYIMEVKTLGALPLWFTKVVNDLKIYPDSFSKYGNIYKQKIKEELSYV